MGLNSDQTFVGKDRALPVLGNQLLNLFLSDSLDPLYLSSFSWVEKTYHSRPEALIYRRPGCRFGLWLVSGNLAFEMSDTLIRLFCLPRALNLFSLWKSGISLLMALRLCLCDYLPIKALNPESQTSFPKQTHCCVKRHIIFTVEGRSCLERPLSMGRV